MGYSITFVPPKEFVEKTKKEVFLAKETHKYELQTRMEILVYCLNELKEQGVLQACETLAFRLDYLKELAKGAVWKSAFDEFEECGSITFCGWEYSHEYCDTDYREVFDYTLEELILLKNIPTPDYFDSSDKWCEKVNEIKGKLEYFADECAKIETYEVMEKFKPYKEKYDDEDDVCEDEPKNETCKDTCQNKVKEEEKDGE